jgi:hypothetical protein
VDTMVGQADSAVADGAVLDVVIEGPEASELTDGDLRRLFRGGAVTGRRLERLRSWLRFVVRLDGVVVGVATYLLVEGETRIPDFALDIPRSLTADSARLERRVLYALLDAIEIASRAIACRRITLIPPRVAAACLERRGYVGIREGCAGAWMEKLLS